MQSAPLPANEAIRLAALDSYDVLYSPAEERFDRVTRVAAQALNAPISLVTLVDATLQWFKSRVGLALDQTAREISFCAHAILRERPLVVPDSKRDPRFRDNPLVLGSPFIRFYVGIPLRLADGLMAGTLCVMDTVPRALSGRELAMLVDLASVIENELRQERSGVARQAEVALMAQGQRTAILDGPTGCWNRAGFESLLQVEVEYARASGRSFALVMLALGDFYTLNQQEGAELGEQVLLECASRLRRALNGAGTVTRLGFETFALVVSPCDKSGLLRVQRGVRAAIQSKPFALTPNRVQLMSVSTGGALVSQPGFDGALAVVDADRRLNLARRAHRRGS